MPRFFGCRKAPLDVEEEVLGMDEHIKVLSISNPAITRVEMNMVNKSTRYSYTCDLFDKIDFICFNVPHIELPYKIYKCQTQSTLGHT